MTGPLPHHEAELAQVAAEGIDELSPLTNQQITGAEYDGRALRLRALRSAEPHRCAASQIGSASAMSFFCRFTNGFT